MDIEGHGKWSDKTPMWTFDGNYDSPTFSPSMLSNKGRVDGHHPICHSFLRNGKWEYLNDSTHDMAGQTVELPTPDPDLSFERQHGWHLYPYWQEKD